MCGGGHTGKMHQNVFSAGFQKVKINQKYIEYALQTHLKAITEPDFQCISHVLSKNTHVFSDSDKYKKNTCNSHVFLMYFSCI